jgi:myo-inositol-1(or 4)-monophosphatase
LRSIVPLLLTVYPFSQMPDLNLYLDVATEAALAAGEVLQHYWGNLKSIESKGRMGDLVTEADKLSEAAILSVLGRRVPEHSILAEESGAHGSLDAEFLWAIDPLDGTTNYAHQYPFSGASIGLLMNGKPVVGAIFDPFHRELFCGGVGLGATCNDRPISVSPTAKLSDSLLVTGFAYDRRETVDNNYREFCYLTHITQGVRRGGAASIDLAYVACGRLDGYWERGLSPWDLAAGVAILEAAGGTVTAYDRSAFDIRSGRILATNTHLHPELSRELLHIAGVENWWDTIISSVNGEVNK